MKLLVNNIVANKLLSEAISSINKQIALFEWEKTNKTGRYAKLFDTYTADINNKIEGLNEDKREYELTLQHLPFAEQVSFDLYDFEYFETLKSDKYFSNWEMRYAGRSPTIAVSDAACA